jgi:hypothetical protein
VRGRESQWIYEGKCLEQAKTGKGIPTIEITDERWRAAVERLGKGEPVPVYSRFALDAIYFAEHDPLRGIIMACVAFLMGNDSIQHVDHPADPIDNSALGASRLEIRTQHLKSVTAKSIVGWHVP